MKLALFKTLWGHEGTLAEAITSCHNSGWDGLEGPAPHTRGERAEFRARLEDASLRFIAEICTAGSYVPDRNATQEQHLESMRFNSEAAMDCGPLFLTIIGGCDAWSVSQSVEFFGQCMAVAGCLGIQASFETHRSRSLFNPWTTLEILRQLPELRLTCDYSHWCVVCERLLDTEPEVLEVCAERARHIHGRVGYAQGPQVPHPAAAEFCEELAAHERWWSQIWCSQRAKGMAQTTFTPEFGPDGYLHCLPFSAAPVADLHEVNSWIAFRAKNRFHELHPGPHESDTGLPAPSTPVANLS
jgi:hypothetical protein